MEIVVFAEQFRSGSWDVWEHRCSPREVQAVVDTARVRANVRSLNGRLIHDDFLEGARCMFDVARGTANDPRDGDTQVYCVCVDQVVIGVYQKVRRYSQRFAEAHACAELQKSA
ncbi:MAG: hypothetical protein WB341_13595 [Terracidiphilus sp.]